MDDFTWPADVPLDEPPFIYAGVDQLSNENLGKAWQWIRWARTKIESLKADQYENDGIIIELRKTVNEQHAKLAKQKEAIEGLQKWQKLSKEQQVETLELGTEVLLGGIGSHGRKGKVVGVGIEQKVCTQGKLVNVVKYYVRYWDGLRCRCTWLSPDDFEVVSDHLPLPGTEGE